MDKVRNTLGQLGGITAIALDGVLSLRRRPLQFSEFKDQAWFITKVSAIPLVLIAVPFGMIIALHVGSFFRQLGAESQIGSALLLATVREQAPIATALLIAGAGGSAMTADIGSRRIRDEIDAMEVMGVDPMHRLIGPRLIAATVCSMLFCSIVAVAGILGGWFFAVPVQGGTTGAYFSSLSALAQLPDFLMMIAKAVFFGFTAGAVACYKGFTVKGGPKGVGDAVQASVVITFILLFFQNFLLTAMYFNLIPQKV
ncbi:MlaE family ABC transporter permease [Euzebya sp.]|uniref:MlaE family ABC transporter permease n=1 Tax=Euzebya sp. TaxID=1971409 RepID=UPI0035135D84